MVSEQVSVFHETKVFGSSSGAEGISQEEISALKALNFDVSSLDETARYMLFDLRPYQDLSEGRPGVQAMRKVWRDFAKLKEGPLIWSKDNGCFLVDMFYVDNERGEIPTLEIFDDSSIPASPRATRVTSTLIEWLGTNVGKHELRACEDFYLETKGIISRPEAYALHSCKKWGRSLGVSLPDKLAHKFQEVTGQACYMDAKMMQCVMYWLGTEKGQGMIEHARILEKNMGLLNNSGYCPPSPPSRE